MLSLLTKSIYFKIYELSWFEILIFFKLGYLSTFFPTEHYFNLGDGSVDMSYFQRTMDQTWRERDIGFLEIMRMAGIIAYEGLPDKLMTDSKIIPKLLVINKQSIKNDTFIRFH